jgi:PIN domain nuclease of toxin-antitoxin system
VTHHGFLLDTNIALFAAAAPERLSPAVRAALKSGPNVMSVIAFWEVMLKSAKGKLDVGDPLAWWEKSLTDFAAISLPLRPAHIAEIQHLAAIHQDPFDRAFIAQSIVEGYTLLTADAVVREYANKRFRVIG